VCTRPGSFDELIRVDEASASNKIVECLIGHTDTLALSSLTGCSFRNSSTVLSSYESEMKSAREEHKRDLTETLLPKRVVIQYDCHKMV
jgi:hypothetical protein